MSIFQQAIFSQGRRRASSGTVTPELLSLSGVLALYRADLGVTLAGSTVTRWEDQTGNGFHLTTSVGPTYQSSYSLFNNRPVINFNTQWLTCSYIPQKGTVSATGEQSGTTVIAFFSNGASPPGTSPRFIANWGSGDNNSMHLRNVSNSYLYETLYALSGTYSGRRMDSGEEVNITGSYVVISTYQKQTNGYIGIKMNGIAGSTVQGTGLSSNKFNEGPLFVGTNTSFAAVNSFSGSLAELVIINNEITSGTLQTILQYANSRYGIPSGSI